MIPVFRRLYEACMERALPIGCAPNVHVRFPWQNLKLKAMAKVFAGRFGRRLAAKGAAREVRSLARERTA